MKKTIQYIAMAALCFFLSSQAYSQIAPLKIGDKVPDNIWTIPLQVVNYPGGKKTISLNDSRGKLIILDFWATWCGSCISGMQKIHALKEQFRDRVEIITVTIETAEKAQKFLQTNPRVKDLGMFSVTGKNALHEYFPYAVLPHYAWISAEGKLIAASSDEQITATNLNKVLQGSELQFAMKEFLDRNKPIFLDHVPKNTLLKKYAVLVEGKVEGLPAVRTTRKTGEQITGVCYSNLPLMSIYRGIALDLIHNLRGKQFLAEVENTDALLLAGKMQDRNYYTFDYEDPDYQIERLLNQLNASSGYDGRLEKRTADCLLLVRTGSKDLIRSKGGNKMYELFNKDVSSLRNAPVSWLVNRLNDNDVAGPFVIDQSDYQHPIDLDINARPDDLQGIIKELNKYGLDLVKARREIDLFVISAQATKTNFFKQPNISEK